MIPELIAALSDGRVRVLDVRLPGRVRETMLERLARLSDSARRTALVASVLATYAPARRAAATNRSARSVSAD